MKITAPTFLLLLSVHFAFSQGVDQKSPSMFRGNAQLTGVYNARATYQLKGVKFTFKADGPIRSTPVLANGLLLFGCGDGNLYAIDSQSGQERWRFKTGGAISTSPATTDGVVYFTSRDENFYALQVTTGKELWRFKMGKDLTYPNGWDYFLSSPTIVGQQLFVGSGDGYLYSFDLKTKKVLWKFNAGTRIRTAPAVFENQVLFGSMDGYLYNIRKDDGTQTWKFATDGSKLRFEDFGFDATAIVCSPAIKDGIVTVGARDGFLYAIDLATGKEKWRSNHNGSWVLSTSINDGTVFAGSGSSAFVQALDAKTGTEKWRFKTQGGVWSTLALAEGMIYFGDFTGNFYALDSKTGKEKWRFSMGKRSMSSPLIVDGVVYCSGDLGIMYALEGSSTAPATERIKAKKVVYWEGPKSDKAFNWFKNGTDVFIRDYFKNNGYELVDAKKLEAFMKLQVDAKSPSVVVFASNNVPPSLMETASENAVIRQYLNAGGKVTFLGPNPLAYYFNPTTGQVDSLNFTTRPGKITGVRYDAPGGINQAAAYGSRVTNEGERWGLRGWWVGVGSVDPAQVTTVLAKDEYGLASCWVKNYGGPEGTGLVQLFIPNEVAGTDLFPIRAVIEYGLDW